MRFKLKSKPNKHDMRVVQRFAWFPIMIDREIRWLEKISILQEYYAPHGDGYVFWHNVEFYDNGEVEGSK